MIPLFFAILNDFKEVSSKNVINITNILQICLLSTLIFHLLSKDTKPALSLSKKAAVI